MATRDVARRLVRSVGDGFSIGYPGSAGGAKEVYEIMPQGVELPEEVVLWLEANRRFFPAFHIKSQVAEEATSEDSESEGE